MIPSCIPTVIVFTNSSHRMSTVPGLRKPHACTLAALALDEAFAFGDGVAFNFPIFITFTFDAALFDAALFFAVVFPFAAFARILSAAVVP